MRELGEELPDNSPRFVVLSYPLTLVRLPPKSPELIGRTFVDRRMWGGMQASGRASVPYVMVNYLPPTCSSELRMLYAGAKELMRRQAEAGRVVEIESAEELEGIEERLKGED
ncbi:hypothetical protein B0A54_09767 [Friedmanniomyces endolithicus]|nr:hypothetical protein B0A54_09767 [Friedmanniomyces endolithicus]